jgi:PhoPQ-activated pathogenicity-related protein
MVVFRCQAAAIVALVATIFSLTNAYDWDVQTDLDIYVHSDDGFFSYTEVTSYRDEGVTMYILNMTSQKYQDETYVDHPVWWHIMGIAIPDQIDYDDFAILWIGGGNNDDVEIIPPQNELTNTIITQLANDSKTIAGYIKQVPNHPLVFADDPSQVPRYENDVIAWTWRSYLNNPAPDNTVLARMPMTKAAKRGLDTIFQFAQEKVPTSNIQRFAVAGPSEGAWTTFSLGVTDRRVVVIAPMVFSLLNAQETLMNHFRSMDGAWSFAFEPYYKVNLTQDFFNPKTEGIYDVEDMYRYRERMTFPILTIGATGDELFLADENRFWWDAIPSTTKYMLMLANAEHYMFPHYNQVYDTALSALLTYLQGGPYPQITWQINPTATGGEILLQTNPIPVQLLAYRAVTLGNDTRRDFRLASGVPGDVNQHPVRWRQDIPIEDLGGGNYRIAADEVPGEWVGFFFEGQYAGPSGLTMSYSTQVSIIPATYPQDPCTDAASCYGTLV